MKGSVRWQFNSSTTNGNMPSILKTIKPLLDNLFDCKSVFDHGDNTAVRYASIHEILFTRPEAERLPNTTSTLIEVVASPWTVWVFRHSNNTPAVIVFGESTKGIGSAGVSELINYAELCRVRTANRTNGDCSHIGPLIHILARTDSKTTTGTVSITIQSIPTGMDELNIAVMRLIPAGVDKLKTIFSRDPDRVRSFLGPPGTRIARLTFDRIKSGSIRRNFVAARMLNGGIENLRWLRVDMLHEPDDTQQLQPQKGE